MMVYKYWDSITKEDLEFSVASKANVWLLHEDKDMEFEKTGYGTGAYPAPAPGGFSRNEGGYGI